MTALWLRTTLWKQLLGHPRAMPGVWGRFALHRILPRKEFMGRKRSLWVWKLGSVKATAKACKRASSDGMIDHTEGGSWLLGECQRHGFNLKYTEVLPPFP